MVVFEQHSFTPSDAPSHKLVLLVPASAAQGAGNWLVDLNFGRAIKLT
jgi:hypothetical protein